MTISEMDNKAQKTKDVTSAFIVILLFV